MNTITIEVPEGKIAKLEGNTLKFVDKHRLEFKPGDKVIAKNDDESTTIGRIGRIINIDSLPIYELENGKQYLSISLKLYDITEHIKTFEDACEWCEKKERYNLLNDYDFVATKNSDYDDFSADLLAYLKLRIITCALNEGWEPTFCADETRYAPHYYTDPEDPISTTPNSWFSIEGASSAKLSFKSKELAKYAATQFKDIYMDFCFKGKD